MITEEYLRNAYLVQHKTLQEIADEVGCSKVNVHRYKRKYRLQTQDATWVTYLCDTCRQKSRMPRSRFLNRVKHFCCHSCYMDYLRTDRYVQSRTGQRIARRMMEEKLERALRPEEVVHYEDGNDNHNYYDNFRLFACHADHMKYHHKKRQESISVQNSPLIP